MNLNFEFDADKCFAIGHFEDEFRKKGIFDNDIDYNDEADVWFLETHEHLETITQTRGNHSAHGTAPYVGGYIAQNSRVSITNDGNKIYRPQMQRVEKNNKRVVFNVKKSAHGNENINTSNQSRLNKENLRGQKKGQKSPAFPKKPDQNNQKIPLRFVEMADVSERLKDQKRTKRDDYQIVREFGEQNQGPRTLSQIVRKNNLVKAKIQIPEKPLIIATSQVQSGQGQQNLNNFKKKLDYGNDLPYPTLQNSTIPLESAENQDTHNIYTSENQLQSNQASDENHTQIQAVFQAQFPIRAQISAQSQTQILPLQREEQTPSHHPSNKTDQVSQNSQVLGQTEGDRSNHNLSAKKLQSNHEKSQHQKQKDSQIKQSQVKLIANSGSKEPQQSKPENQLLKTQNKQSQQLQQQQQQSQDQQDQQPVSSFVVYKIEQDPQKSEVKMSQGKLKYPVLNIHSTRKKAQENETSQQSDLVQVSPITNFERSQVKLVYTSLNFENLHNREELLIPEQTAFTLNQDFQIKNFEKLKIEEPQQNQNVQSASQGQDLKLSKEFQVFQQGNLDQSGHKSSCKILGKSDLKRGQQTSQIERSLIKQHTPLSSKGNDRQKTPQNQKNQNYLNSQNSQKSQKNQTTQNYESNQKSEVREKSNLKPRINNLENSELNLKIGDQKNQEVGQKMEDLEYSQIKEQKSLQRSNDQVFQPQQQQSAKMNSDTQGQPLNCQLFQMQEQKLSDNQIQYLNSKTQSPFSQQKDDRGQQQNITNEGSNISKQHSFNSNFQLLEEGSQISAISSHLVREGQEIRTPLPREGQEIQTQLPREGQEISSQRMQIESESNQKIDQQKADNEARSEINFESVQMTQSMNFEDEEGAMRGKLKKQQKSQKQNRIWNPFSRTNSISSNIYGGLSQRQQSQQDMHNTTKAADARRRLVRTNSVSSEQNGSLSLKSLNPRSKSEQKTIQISYIARPQNFKKLRQWEKINNKKWENLSLAEKQIAEKEINNLII